MANHAPSNSRRHRRGVGVAMKQVTVMYRNNWFGGDGWTFHAATVEIGELCPICGMPRGKPYLHRFYDTGKSYTVHKWDNSCGHIDTYRNVLIEGKYPQALGLR